MSRFASFRPFVARHRALLVLTAASFAVYGIGGIAWPLTTGRDTGTYIDYYVDILAHRPALPTLMVFRTPLAPLFFGSLLQIGGAALVEIAMGLAFTLSVIAFTAAAAAFGRRCAIVFAVALLLYTPYVALFHQVSSDSLFAFVFAFWTLGVVRTANAPSTRRYALLALGVVVLVLVRPGAQLLLAFGAAPLFFRGLPWRMRLRWIAAFAATAVVLLVGWAGYNDARYGEFTIARGGPANLPAYRVFVIDRLVSPDNGPASRKLAAAVQQHLLPLWPYRQYGITTHTFFSSMNDTFWNDLVVLSDQVWGWNSNYSELRTVALEAIRRHPKQYAKSVLDDVWYSFRASYSLPASKVRVVPPAAPSKQPATTNAPPPPAGQLIPSYRLWWVMSSPDRRVRFTRTGLVWRNPSDAAHYARLTRRVRSLTSDLPNRSGSPGWASALNTWARIYPRMFIWLLLAGVALLVRRPRRAWPVVVLAVLGALVVVVTVAGLPPVLDYRAPFDPAFILVGVVSVLAPAAAKDRVLAEAEDAEEERRERALHGAGQQRQAEDP